MASTTVSSRAYFAANAGQLRVTITDESTGKVLFVQLMNPTTFSTGSVGWNTSGKADIPVGPIELPTAQVGVNVTMVNSKSLAGFVPKAA